VTDAEIISHPFAVLAAGGPLAEAAVPLLRRDSAGAALLVGIDSGARHLRAAGLVPHVVTGDFDSLTDEELKTLHSAGVEIVPTPDQDYTDLDKALDYTINQRGIKTVRIYAATGGRLDHTYSCLSAVVKYGATAEVRLVDEYGVTWLVPPGETMTLTGDDLPGRTLSLITLGEVNGITATGVRWPLNNEPLAPGIRDGTLNQIIESPATVQCREGKLLLMLHHPEP
jgi:thiamine pyrophosphokinase